MLAWARLLKAQGKALGAVERALKSAGLPPLTWYDVLLELRRVGSEGLRPMDLEQHLLLAQHNVSRLLDRLQAAGLIRRAPHEVDGRGQVVTITPAGRMTLKKMWPVYAAAIEREVGEKLSETEAQTLANLLAKLIR